MKLILVAQSMSDVMKELKAFELTRAFRLTCDQIGNWRVRCKQNGKRDLRKKGLHRRERNSCSRCEDCSCVHDLCKRTRDLYLNVAPEGMQDVPIMSKTDPCCAQ